MSVFAKTPSSIDIYLSCCTSEEVKNIGSARGKDYPSYGSAKGKVWVCIDRTIEEIRWGVTCTPEIHGRICMKTGEMSGAAFPVGLIEVSSQKK